MNYLIIHSHPYKGSFNSAIVENLKDHKNATVIDLIKDEFNPVMGQEDLRLWGKGEPADQLVRKYQEEFKKADIIVFPFPIWWGVMPAVLKGFIDKVFLPGFAYKYNEKGEMLGLLEGKKAVVITTMETPKEFYNDVLNNPIENTFIKNTLLKCGIETIKHFEVDKIVSSGEEYTTDKMNHIMSFFESF